MKIRKLTQEEPAPMDLLLLADPSPELVNDYLVQGECFIAEDEGDVIGVYVLIPIETGTIELINIAVSESHQGRGFGKRLIMDAIEQAKREGYQK